MICCSEETCSEILSRYEKKYPIVSYFSRRIPDGSSYPSPVTGIVVIRDILHLLYSRFSLKPCPSFPRVICICSAPSYENITLLRILFEDISYVSLSVVEKKFPPVVYRYLDPRELYCAILSDRRKKVIISDDVESSHRLKELLLQYGEQCRKPVQENSSTSAWRYEILPSTAISDGSFSSVCYLLDVQMLPELSSFSEIHFAVFSEKTPGYIPLLPEEYVREKDYSVKLWAEKNISKSGQYMPSQIRRWTHLKQWEKTRQSILGTRRNAWSVFMEELLFFVFPDVLIQCANRRYYPRNIFDGVLLRDVGFLYEYFDPSYPYIQEYYERYWIYGNWLRNRLKILCSMRNALLSSAGTSDTRVRYDCWKKLCSHGKYRESISPEGTLTFTLSFPVEFFQGKRSSSPNTDHAYLLLQRIECMWDIHGLTGSMGSEYLRFWLMNHMLLPNVSKKCMDGKTIVYTVENVHPLLCDISAMLYPRLEVSRMDSLSANTGEYREKDGNISLPVRRRR